MEFFHIIYEDSSFIHILHENCTESVENIFSKITYLYKGAKESKNRDNQIKCFNCKKLYPDYFRILLKFYE